MIPQDSSAETVSYAEGMPWDQNHDAIAGKTRGLSEIDSKVQVDNEETETKLKEVLSEICPLLDRMGRAFTDMSPHIHRYYHHPTSETSTPSRLNDPRSGLLPFGIFPRRQMSVSSFYFLSANFFQ